MPKAQRKFLNRIKLDFAPIQKALLAGVTQSQIAANGNIGQMTVSRALSSIQAGQPILYKTAGGIARGLGIEIEKLILKSGPKKIQSRAAAKSSGKEKGASGAR